MAETPAKDISRWQGAYTETGEPIVIIKISGGDDGLYYDSQATNNYNQAIANGHAFGGYHFAGGTDPVAEANFFVNGMKPLLENEVPILDWEIGHPDPVGWCLAFIEQVEAASNDQGGLIYMNLSTLRAHDWSPVLAKWGLWLADWNNDPEGDIDTGGIVYVMQQFNDGPNYDHDMFFGTKEQFQQYGWGNATQPPEQPEPAPTPQPTPTPDPAPAPTPGPTEPAPSPDPTPSPTPTPQPTPEPKPPTPVTKRDVLLRIFHTFWQSFVGLFTVTATGLTSTVLSIHTLSDAKAAGLALLGSAAAAVLSAVKNTIKYYKENKV